MIGFALLFGVHGCDWLTMIFLLEHHRMQEL
jgi:hypothetical protein